METIHLNARCPRQRIPTTLHASLIARLDRLASVREVAQIGAVVGRQFSYELLSTVAGLPRGKLDEAPRSTGSIRIDLRRGENPDAVYTFKHALVRDAAYSGLLKSRRAALHATIADAFEQRFSGDRGAQPETFAHHLTEAGLIEKAEGLWLEASRKRPCALPTWKQSLMRSEVIETLAYLPTARRRTGGSSIFNLLLDRALSRPRVRHRTMQSRHSLAPVNYASASGDPPEHLQVNVLANHRKRHPWRTSNRSPGNDCRPAESPLRRAGDRAALLNAMRGQAMIRLFMGQLTGAQAASGQGASKHSISAAKMNDSQPAKRTRRRCRGHGLDIMDLVAARQMLRCGDRTGCRSHPARAACYRSTRMLASLCLLLRIRSP